MQIDYWHFWTTFFWMFLKRLSWFPVIPFRGKEVQTGPFHAELVHHACKHDALLHHWHVYLPLPRAAVRVVCLGGGAETCLLVLLVTFLPPAWPPFFTAVLVASLEGFGGVAWCFLVGAFGAADSLACGLHLLSFLSTGAQRRRAP